MKRIYLQKIIQHNQECYIGKIDPRELVRVAFHVEIGETQDAQRPLNGKRIKDIAKYVSGEKGILPNTLTLAVENNAFPINDEGNGLYSIQFPETDDEFLRFEDTIFVMDGQHRLYSFLPDMRSISDNEKFEIGFTLYDKPTLTDKQNIFMVCNEKQEKVSGNLLMWFKNQLKMLPEEDVELYNLVSQLNSNFPLKGRIIMGAEKVKNGLKAKEIMKDISKSKIRKLRRKQTRITDEELVKALVEYLSGWQSAVGFSFREPNKASGAATKISGLRFMLFTLPGFWDRAVNKQLHFKQSFVEDTIRHLATQLGILTNEFFTHENIKRNFMERSLTESFAEECCNIVKNISDDFDPLG